MKLTRAAYPLMIGVTLYWLIRPTIKQFSKDLEEIINLPFLIISIILVIFSLLIAYKDNELFHIVRDERSKKIDRIAAFYSWWFTIIFVFVFGLISPFTTVTLIQFVFLITTTMFVSIIIFHMYFNFKENT